MIWDVNNKKLVARIAGYLRDDHLEASADALTEMARAWIARANRMEQILRKYGYHGGLRQASQVGLGLLRAQLTPLPRVRPLPVWRPQGAARRVRRRSSVRARGSRGDPEPDPDRDRVRAAAR
jgi:hypothetical protein